MNDDAQQGPRRQIEALERKNKLLDEGLRQAERIRQLWADAVRELKATKDELSAAREFLDRVLAVAPDPIVVADHRGRIVLANLATADLTGLPQERLVGRNVLRLLARPRRKNALARFRENSVSGADEFSVRSPKGARLVAAGWAALRDSRPGQARIVLAGRDITESRRNERLLELENSLAAPASGVLTLPQIMEGLCRGLEQMLDDAPCSILLLDDDGIHLRHGAATGLPDAYSRAIDGLAIGPAAGWCGAAVYLNKEVIVPDIARDPRWGAHGDLALGNGLRACWSVPIRTASGAVFGVLAIYHRAPYVPTQFDLLTATRASRLASIAIQRKRTEEALVRSEAQLHEITATIGEGVYVLDASGVVTFVNPEMERQLGWAASELIGKNGHELFHYKRPDGTPLPLADCPVHKSINTGETYRGIDDWLIRKDGTFVPVSIVSSPIVRDGRTAGSVAAFQDISERKNAEEQIRQLAFFDTLTGLPNRRLLLDRLNHALAQAKRYRRSMAVMFLDLDRFKQVNDTLGHDAGDELLKAVAVRLASCVRRGDTVSRQGGDEFVTVLAEISDSRDAALVAGRFIDSLGQPVSIKSHTLIVTTSIGIAIYSGGMENAESLMKKADAAMYRAKSGGRNRYEFYRDAEAGSPA